jgi:hypothetical protein
MRVIYPVCVVLLGCCHQDAQVVLDVQKWLADQGSKVKVRQDVRPAGFRGLG